MGNTTTQPKLECPTCAKDHLSSSVHSTITGSTLQGLGSPHYDATSGKWLQTDNNIHTYHCLCSNGHTWTERRGVTSIRS